VASTGHGPHVLAFDRTQVLNGESRLAGTTRAHRTSGCFPWRANHVTLSIDGDGMTASLQAEAADQSAPPLGRLLAGTKFVAELPAGSYRWPPAALAVTTGFHTRSRCTPTNCSPPHRAG